MPCSSYTLLLYVALCLYRFRNSLPPNRCVGSAHFFTLETDPTYIHTPDGRDKDDGKRNGLKSTKRMPLLPPCVSVCVCASTANMAPATKHISSTNPLASWTCVCARVCAIFHKTFFIFHLPTLFPAIVRPAPCRVCFRFSSFPVISGQCPMFMPFRATIARQRDIQRTRGGAHTCRGGKAQEMKN